MNNEENKPMNKNLNDVVELTESQLAGVIGGAGDPPPSSIPPNGEQNNMGILW